MRRVVVQEFIKTHNLNIEELLDPLDSFKTFNEFFFRKLRPGVRPIAALGNDAVCVLCG